MGSKRHWTMIFWGSAALYGALLSWLLITFPHTYQSVPALTHIAKAGSNGPARGLATELLAAKGEAGLKALLELMQDPNINVRTYAVLGIWRVKPAPIEAVPLLIKALGEGDRGLRAYALMAMANQRAQASDAVPALIPLLKDTDPITRSSARSILENIATPEAQAALKGPGDKP